MTDTTFWIPTAIAVVALLVSLLAYRTASEARHSARGGAGEGGAPAKGSPKSERDAGQKLAARAGALLVKVNALPPALLGPGNDARARDGALWTAAEVSSLRATSPALAAASADAFSSLEPSLEWLFKQVESIRATPRGSGTYLIDFPHDTWRRHYQTALTELQELVARGEAAAKNSY